MKAYWIEGVYLTKQGVKKARRSGKAAAADLSPFGKVIWAATPEEALRQAGEMLAGGEWQDGPRLSLKSEEQRMRQMGMPELPGLGTKKKK